MIKNKFKSPIIAVLLIFLLTFTGCVQNVSVADVPDNVSINNFPLDEKGHLEVAIQDQHTDVIDYYLRRSVQILTFDGPQILDSYNVTVTNATGITIGNYLRVQEGSRLFQAQIIGIVSNTLNLDTPIDFPYTPLADVSEATVNMNVDGSITPLIFSLEPTQVNQSWDIVRIICSMTHSSAGDDSRFGGISGGLTRGIILRKTNGIHHTIFNAKTNGNLRLRMFDLLYSDKAGGGLFGTTFRRTFGGQSKNGVTIRLEANKNESFQLVVQDDITGLDNFNCVLQGHIVEN